MTNRTYNYCIKMTDDDKVFFKTLGKKIAQLRKSQHMTQSHLAEYLGISQQHIASFEKGLRKLPVSMLPLLSQLYGITIDELLELENTKCKPGPIPKLQKQVEQIALLSKVKQKFVSEMLDTVIQKNNG